MTIDTFVKHYNLHDSYITILEYSQDENTLTMYINFAFWMQESFKEGTPENGIIKVVFHNVSQYLCDGGDPTGAFVGILGSEYKNDTFILKLLDDETNMYFEVHIISDSVEVTTV